MLLFKIDSMSKENIHSWILLFFQAVNKERYAVIKWREKLENYTLGDDIDIICNDIVGFFRQMMLVGNQFVADGGEICIWSARDNSQIHLDLKRQGELLFRFDIYKGVPLYTLLTINSQFLDVALAGHLVDMVEKIPIKFVSVDCDMIFRYAEYLEYGAITYRKAQHYHWVLQKFNQHKGNFLNFVKNYTDLPIDICKAILMDNLPTRESFLSFKSSN